jgi:CDP-glycerol glycerophosphotransferase (TagB/SpsB family)
MVHTEKKGVGINPSSQIHYTDHLAVICILMDIPLLFLDPLDYQLGSRFYPGLKSLEMAYEEFSPEYLVENYDVLFMSDLWDQKTFNERFGPLEAEYGKVMRHVHVPHGYSDKAFYLKKCANEDITLIYGQNMIDMLKLNKVFEQIKGRYVISGNYRYTYFKQHQTFYDEVMRTEVLNHFEKPSQPFILYAPTWLDLEESTSFFEAYNGILGQLPKEYNLIVKLHPRLELDDTALYYHIVGQYEHQPNILFLKDFPLVYPLLSHAHIYLGDMSSVGYDFLPFNRPMFFLNQQKRNPALDRGLYLFRCGVEIMPEQYDKIYSIIEKSLPNDSEQFSQIRSQVYDYTFGEERPFDAIKADIIAAYQ